MVTSLTHTHHNEREHSRCADAGVPGAGGGSWNVRTVRASSGMLVWFWNWFFNSAARRRCCAAAGPRAHA